MIWLLALALTADVPPAVDEATGTTRLLRAVYDDDLAVASELIRAGADVKRPNRYGETPLRLAAENGNLEMIDLLLRAGAEVNGPDQPLMTAARTGRAAVVKRLLEAGANPRSREARSGQTALMWAAAEGNGEAVETLLAAGAELEARVDSGFTALLFAVREGKVAAARALLKAGAPANDTVRPNAAVPRKGNWPRTGLSALVLAATNGHFELASILLDAGADPNAADAGYTALHVISHVRKPGGGDNDPPPDGSGEVSSLELARRLVAKGANPNARMTRRVGFGLTSLNTLGATPFFLAAKTADAELMRELARLGADPKIPNADGSTPLMAAAGLGTRSPGEDAGTESEVVEALGVALDLGNDIDAVDSNGETAMHGAAYKNLPGAVEYLAKRGAKIAVWNRPNKQGWTPLIIAKGYRFGNFKPSTVTVEAIRRVLAAAGVEPAPGIERNK